MIVFPEVLIILNWGEKEQISQMATLLGSQY